MADIDPAHDRDGSGSTGSGLLTGKRGLILGVANNRSIAWGIAKARTPTAPSSPSPTRATP